MGIKFWAADAKTHACQTQHWNSQRCHMLGGRGKDWHIPSWKCIDMNYFFTGSPFGNTPTLEVFGIWASEVRFAYGFVQAPRPDTADTAWKLLAATTGRLGSHRLRYGQGRGLPLQTVAQYARHGTWTKELGGQLGGNLHEIAHRDIAHKDIL